MQHWKDADPDTLIPKRAEAEYGKSNRNRPGACDPLAEAPAQTAA
ncbi:MAG: hypothetical protein WCE53_17365 [Candidatus Acidiferrum sp.]